MADQEVLPIKWSEAQYGSNNSGMIGSYHVADVWWADGAYRVRVYMFNCSSTWKGFKNIDNAKTFAQKALADKLWEIVL